MHREFNARRLAKPLIFCLALIAAGGLSVPKSGHADQPPAYLVRIPIPIIGNIDERVKREVEQLMSVDNPSPKRPILVLEFWPPEDISQSATSQFERSLALANYLASERLSKIRTIAYVPRTVVGHAVLPVMACEEIIMAPDAKLGDAGRSDSLISQTIRGAYREIANRRRTIPEDVALGMLDKQLKVWKLDTPDGTRFALDQELDQIRKDSVIDEMKTMKDEGVTGIFTGMELRQDYGIVNRLASNRQDLSEILGVPVGDLDPDPSRGGVWQAVRIELNGVITVQAANRIQKVIEDAIRARIQICCAWSSIVQVDRLRAACGSQTCWRRWMRLKFVRWRMSHTKLAAMQPLSL